ncbi:MAG: hypothetical protein EPN47_07250 [Acidobacteria bacterium]|nr:MAG: hypothetical protein EPN47_07250 [Acidobacteriota bacterium]
MINRNDAFDPLDSPAGHMTAPVSSLGDAPSSRRDLTIGYVLRKVFSFHAFLAALLLGGAYVGTFTNIHQALTPGSQSLRWVESDTLWHVTVGNLILRTHIWPTHDIYSFTVHGSPWIAYEWLGEVVMALAWRVGNLHGLAVLVLAIISAIILGLFYLAYLGSKSSKSAFAACAVLLPLSAISWTLRPQLLGYVFLIITLIVLKRFRQGHRKSIWVLPLIFLLWTNTHGTFILGFGVLGIYWLSGLKELHFGDIYGQRWTPRERRQLELIALLSLIASIITPYGTQLAAYPLEMAGSQPMIIQIVQEWQPLALSESYGKLFLVLLFAFWVLVIARRFRIRLEDVALLLIATAETVMHARFMVFFVPVFAPLLAELTAPWFPPYAETKDHPVLNFALIGLIIAGIAVFFPSSARLEQQLASEMPTGAVHYLAAHPDLGPTFNYFFWGGHLIQNHTPEGKVFIDGRLDIYEYSGVLADYMSIMSLKPDVEPLLSKYHVRSCLVPPDNQLATLLASSSGWKQVYRDGISAIFVRENAELNPRNAAAVNGKITKRKILSAGA